MNAPVVEWTGPDKFKLRSNPKAPFVFRRHNGDVIHPAPMLTDAGSVPPQFWQFRGMTPWTYAPGYLVHDWLYESKRRGSPVMGTSPSGQRVPILKEEADWILAEVIKTQMLDDNVKYKNDPKPTRLFLIYQAVKVGGWKAYNGEGTPVEEDSALTAQEAVSATIPDIIKDPVTAIGLQLTPPPQKPASLD